MLTTVQQHLSGGNLDAAIDSQVEMVRSEPSNTDQRYGLVGLLVLQGDFDRAEAHLRAMADQDQALLPGVAVYRSLLSAEEERRRVYEDGIAPNLHPEAGTATAKRCRALQELALGHLAAAERSLTAAPDDPNGTRRLKVNGDSFQTVRDYDDFLGPVLEVFAAERYLWIPFARLSSLSFQEPRGLLDLIWAPGELTEIDGTTARVYVPVLYQGSSAHADRQVRTGRRTEWTDVGGFAFRGAGQRVLLADEDHEIALLSVRHLEFEPESAES